MDKKELLFDVIPAEKGDGKSAEDFCGTSPTQATASGIVKGKAPPTSPVRKWTQITAMILVALILAAIVTGLLVAFIPSGSVRVRYSDVGGRFWKLYLWPFHTRSQSSSFERRL